MKSKIFLLVIVTVVAIGNVWSQTPSSEGTSKTRCGIKAGLNAATVIPSIWQWGWNRDESESERIGYVYGAVAGITLEQTLVSSFFFRSGFELNMKGFTYDTGSATLKSTAVYLQIPLAFGGKYDIGKKWEIGVQVGPYFAYGIAGDTSSDGSGSVGTFSNKIFKPFDMGTLVGLEFAYCVDSGKFVLGVNIESSIPKVNGDNFDIMDAKVYNQNISITLGYMF